MNILSLSISEKIAQYQAANDQLRRAVEVDGASELNSLDKEVSSKFGAILTASPADHDDTYRLVEFLLDQLLRFEDASNLVEDIRARILQLVLDAHRISPEGDK